MSQNTRMTKQRALILQELRNVCSHPTADEIYGMVRRALPRISLGTVYRNLDFLTESGAILKLEHAGEQKRFDGNTKAHQHVRCRKCGRVSDVMPEVPLPPLPDMRVPGFTVTEARLEFYGLCQDCA